MTKLDGKNRTFVFLSLPPEIRNNIYEYVFGNNEWKVHTADMFKAKNPPPNALSLLQTCRTINLEAQQYPFRLNTFKLKHGLNPNSVIPTGARWITSIVLKNWGSWYDEPRYRSRIFCLPHHFPNLHKIDIISGREYESERLMEVIELEGMMVADIVSECFPEAFLTLCLITTKGKTVIEDSQLRKRIADYGEPASPGLLEYWTEWKEGGISWDG
ncbi:hypothetical protein DM02DRAFT_621758 [Periconia macrospinosa]|uniref:F-box domain-containing protein n=1 Tax=Periconia macrospinosa TaxID=97972 RepID=A0A2V1EC83_9PLEO|nr:hypothetical protein DM02DRAFT_621758 [Periconia macrospinosa]